MEGYLLHLVEAGKLNPEEEIELKPQISGIVDQIFVEEGDLVRKGDLIAKIRVVPNEQALGSAKSRINTARLSFENAQTPVSYTHLTLPTNREV